MPNCEKRWWKVIQKPKEHIKSHKRCLLSLKITKVDDKSKNLQWNEPFSGCIIFPKLQISAKKYFFCISKCKFWRVKTNRNQLIRFFYTEINRRLKKPSRFGSSEYCFFEITSFWVVYKLA